MKEERFRCTKCGAITQIVAVETIQWAEGIYDEYTCDCPECNHQDIFKRDLTPASWFEEGDG